MLIVLPWVSFVCFLLISGLAVRVAGAQGHWLDWHRWSASDLAFTKVVWTGNMCSWHAACADLEVVVQLGMGWFARATPLPLALECSSLPLPLGPVG